MCVCLCHSLITDSVTSHPVFLTHLQQNCNLAHWTFKLLDVTSKGIGEEKHYPLLIVTSLTSCQTCVCFSANLLFYLLLSPDYFFSTCLFLNGRTPLVQFEGFIGIRVQYWQNRMSVFTLCRACLCTEIINGIFNHLIWGPPLRLSRTMWKEQQDGDAAERFPPFMLHGVNACSVSFPLRFTSRCLRLLVSLCFVFCLSPHVSHPILQLQDYRAEGRSRCVLD